LSNPIASRLASEASCLGARGRAAEAMHLGPIGVSAFEGIRYHPRWLLQPSDVAEIDVHTPVPPGTAEVTDVVVRPRIPAGAEHVKQGAGRRGGRGRKCQR
jgi:hypothetical protein